MREPSPIGCMAWAVITSTRTSIIHVPADMAAPSHHEFRISTRMGSTAEKTVNPNIAVIGAVRRLMNMSTRVTAPVANANPKDVVNAAARFEGWRSCARFVPMSR